MTTLVTTTSFDRVVKLQEIKDRLSCIELRNALAVVTKVASRQLWFPESERVAAYINLVNLSHLAKAVVLFSAEVGRKVNLSPDEDGDLRWLLTALNSMKWYSDNERDTNLGEAITSFLVRQAYVRNFVGDHPSNVIARAYAMFHEILPRVNNGRVDVDEVMQTVAGVNCRDLWVFCAAIHIFYFVECARPDGPWFFTPDFVADSPRRHELAAILQRVLTRIAKTPQEIQALSTGPKYHNPALPEEYWLSEFNVLRDNPVVRVGDNEYCCPYTTFVWMRGAVGYYFDLVNHFAEIERATHPKNKNPFDNVMGRVLGDAFQEYVGVHLRTLDSAMSALRAEFIYTVGKDELLTPDWLLLRQPELPVLFECKARRPALPLQTRCREADRDAEIESVLSRALGQLTVFLRNATAGKVPGFTPSGDWRVVYALVLYESFPFHALPDIRAKIDRFAEQIEPDWKRFRNHVLFVPLSIQELELAVQIEKEKGVPIERQFREYALYRSTARRMDGSVLAMHFLDFAFAAWGQPTNAVGEVCAEYWNQFCRMMYKALYSGELGDHEAECRRRWIEEAAYFRWLNSGSQHGHALDHWLASEREYDGFVRETGTPPDMAERLAPHLAITRRLQESGQ